jgi:hypothetical protein
MSTEDEIVQDIKYVYNITLSIEDEGKKYEIELFVKVDSDNEADLQTEEELIEGAKALFEEGYPSKAIIGAKLKRLEGEEVTEWLKKSHAWNTRHESHTYN